MGFLTRTSKRFQLMGNSIDKSIKPAAASSSTEALGQQSIGKLLVQYSVPAIIELHPKS